jgi:hypothetical protein
MPQDEAGTWGEPFDEAELPRRDRVPESGFTRPSDVNANPELARFIPPFRMKRRRIAARLTLAVLAAVAFMGIRLAMWTANAGSTDARPSGIAAYFFLVACVVAGFFGLRKTWRWANAPDPADVRNPIMRDLPPLA